MRIFTSELVFNEVFRSCQFADIVIVSPDPREQRVGLHSISARLGQIPNNDAMIESTVSLLGEFLEKGMVKISKFQESQIGSDSENHFKQCADAVCNKRCQYTADGHVEHIVSDVCPVESFDDTNGHKGDGAANNDEKNGRKQLSSCSQLPHSVDGCHAGKERDDSKIQFASNDK